MPISNTERHQLFRLRKAGKLPPYQPPSCSTCGAPHRGAHGSICRSCWRKTPDGLEYVRQTVAASRARRLTP